MIKKNLKIELFIINVGKLQNQTFNPFIETNNISKNTPY